MQTVSNVFHNITDAISDYMGTNVISRAEVIVLEETERERRINQAASSRVAELNAAKVSALIKSTSFPYFGSSSIGFKRVTSSLEENERNRRLTNKSESVLRRVNGGKSAGFVKSLGWPFMQSARSEGAIYVFPDVSELEREARLADSWSQMQSKNNAALISNLIRLEFSHNSSNFGTKRWTRNLEEKERSRRLEDKEALDLSARNAFNTSKIVRNLGWPFYVQDTASADPTIALEEKERDRRMFDKAEQQLARENAGKVFSTLHLNDVGSVEELEKSRRLNDFGEQQHAKELARLVSGLVHKNFAKSETAQRQAGARKIASMVDGLFVPLKTIVLMEERERKRRVNDIEGQTFSRLNAKKVSGLIAADFGASPKALNGLEEEERTRRMWDRQLQSVALSNARKVSRLILDNGKRSSSSITNRKSASRSLEEKERNRRLIDRSYDQLARSHNQKIAGMVFDNSLTLNKGVPSDAISIPIEPLAQTSSFAAPVLPSTFAAPLAAPSLAALAPVSTAPAFISAAPISAAPISPVYATSAPFTPTSTYTSSPAYTSAPVYTNTFIPATAATTSFPASGLQLHNLSDAQKKKLEKQAIKHNKRAEKESKRATHDLAKAEKLHNKGKDGRAYKHETKAEQHTVAAKHHQMWAQDLSKDAIIAPAPVAYRPAM